MAGLLTMAHGASDDVVAETLRQWAALPFVWGKSDCFLSVLDYAEGVTGRKLRSRPRYHSALAANRILRASGGFEAYCEAVMEQLRCAPTNAPVRGDVGLIRLPEMGLTMCLCLGAFWAARADREVAVARMEPVAAWRVTSGGGRCHRR